MIDAIRKRRGPPPGSMNNLRHGLRCGRLFKAAEKIERDTNKFRRQLEDAAGDRAIDVTAHINSATRHERACRLAERWIMKQGDALTPGELATFLNLISRETSARDRSIARALGGDSKAADSDPLDAWQPPGIDDEQAA